jgi:lipopolysaccharide export system protein LptA
MKIRAAFAVPVAVLFLAATVVAAAEQMRLTSDTLQYDPSRGAVVASGNVKVVGRGAEITSDEGEFDSQGTRSWFRKSVLALWPGGDLSMNCDELVVEDGPRGQKITARRVTRFHDPVRNVTMRADVMEGTVAGGVFTDYVARSNVVADAVASGGEPTRVSGQRLRYSKSRGTLELSGEATAIQKDRRITADTLIFYLQSGKIEAVGNPRMVVDLPPQEAQ